MALLHLADYQIIKPKYNNKNCKFDLIVKILGKKRFLKI